MPMHLLAFIAEQVGVAPDAIGGFARRPQTRYEHLAALRKRFGFSDLADASKAELKQWLAPIALKTTDGHAVLVALAEEMRRRRIIIPGISVAERMAAEAMHAADKTAVRLICERVPAEPRARMDALLTEKAHRQLVHDVEEAAPADLRICLAQPAQFALNEQADDAKQRLARVANVLDAILKAHERDESIKAAIAAVTTWEALSADTKLLRRSSRTGMVDVLSELRREHYVFKAIGPRLLNAVTFQSRASAAPLLGVTP
jgi:hypothetical protein